MREGGEEGEGSRGKGHCGKNEGTAVEVTRASGKRSQDREHRAVEGKRSTSEEGEGRAWHHHCHQHSSSLPLHFMHVLCRTS